MRYFVSLALPLFFVPFAKFQMKTWKFLKYFWSIPFSTRNYFHSLLAAVMQTGKARTFFLTIWQKNARLFHLILKISCQVIQYNLYPCLPALFANYNKKWFMLMFMKYLCCDENSNKYVLQIMTPRVTNFRMLKLWNAKICMKKKLPSTEYLQHKQIWCATAENW